MPDRGPYTITVTRFLPSAETHDVMEYAETHERETLGDAQDFVTVISAVAISAREIDAIGYRITAAGGSVTLPDGTEIKVSDQSASPAVIYIAKCSEHGLHGERDECFDCGKPVDQVGFVRADLYLEIRGRLERGRDDAMTAWKSRGRELNEIYDALTAVVEESVPDMDPVADLKALGAQRDRLRAESERLRETMREAAGHLCMTQCPAYTDNGVCSGGCYTEPSCQTDEPTEGWIVAALNLLVPEKDESALPADEQEATP